MQSDKTAIKKQNKKTIKWHAECLFSWWALGGEKKRLEHELGGGLWIFNLSSWNWVTDFYVEIYQTLWVAVMDYLTLVRKVNSCTTDKCKHIKLFFISNAVECVESCNNARKHNHKLVWVIESTSWGTILRGVVSASMQTDRHTKLMSFFQDTMFWFFVNRLYSWWQHPFL